MKNIVIDTPEKKIALHFQNMIISGEIQKAYDLYVHSDFFHHNPYLAGDRISLLQAMEENAKQFPDKIFTPQMVLQEQDRVMVYAQLRLNSEMPEIATIHIFRFENNLIIEEWDLAQSIPPESPNRHSMF